MGKVKNRNVKSMYISLIWVSDIFVVVVVASSRKLSGTFRNCKKLDKWRDEGTVVAPALAGDECSSSWIDTGTCRTEQNFIISALNNGRVFPQQIPAKSRFGWVTDMPNARIPTQMHLEKPEDRASRNPMEFSKEECKILCLGWN